MISSELKLYQRSKKFIWTDEYISKNMLGLCDNMQEGRDWYYSIGEGFWCDSPHFILEEVKHFVDEKAWGSRTIIIEEEKKPREYITWDTYYTEDDIKQILYDNGFGVLFINDRLIDKNEFTSNDVMFIETKKRAYV